MLSASLNKIFSSLLPVFSSEEKDHFHIYIVGPFLTDRGGGDIWFTEFYIKAYQSWDHRLYLVLG